MAKAKAKPTVKRKVKDPLADVTLEIIDMTPDLAEKLLESNTANRKIKPKIVGSYSNAIQIGDWEFNGDPIRVADTGRLIDGQHRLSAICESGLTVPMVLITGIPESAQMTMDIGVARTYADHLKLRGEESVHSLAAVVRMYETYERSLGEDRWLGNPPVRISIAKLDRLLDSNPKLRQSTADARRLYSSGLPLPVGALGVAHYVLNQIDSIDASQFLDRAASGEGLFETDVTQPILKLRQFAQPRKSFEHRRAFVMLGGVFKAWNAYRDGVKISNAAPRFGGTNPEVFPWPI